MSEEQSTQASQVEAGEQTSANSSNEKEGAEFSPITSQEEFDRALSKRLERERAKFANYDELQSKVKEFEKQRKAAMTEAERAADEAEERGRKAATEAFGKRLATAEIRSQASTAGADLAGVFDYLDLARFIGEDGEPDEKAIKSFVAGLPKKDEVPPSYDGGIRSTAPATQGMSGLIRKAAGRA